MAILKVQAPIWHNKSVGIAIGNKADEEVFHIEIEAVRKNGSRYYPNPFTISVAEIKKKRRYVEERRGNKPMLYIVPISELNESKPGEDQTESS